MAYAIQFQLCHAQSATLMHSAGAADIFNRLLSCERAWWNSMKAKQLTHKQLTLRTYIHRYLNTYIHTYLSTYLPTYLHTYHHRPSITLILPLPFSLSVLRLSLKKLLTCGVIRSYNDVFATR